MSALTPEIAARSDLVRGVLPPGVPTAAREVSLALGLALVWLARSLARGRRRAWQLAVAAVIVSAVSHLAKGLDVEEAAATLVLLALLWRTRHHFCAPGSPPTVRLVVSLAGLLALLPPLELAGDRWHANRLEDAVAILAVLVGTRVLVVWLGPLAERAHQSARERARAELLVGEYGADSLAYFALRRDKSYFFSPSGRSFLAYRVVNSTALAAGDPIGDPGEREPLVAEFRRVAHAKGLRIAVAGAGEEALSTYRRLGLRAMRIGDEAVVRPESFTLAGRDMRKVRQSSARLGRAGFRMRIVAAGDVDEQLRAQLCEVSRCWRGSWPERGFTMAMDALFSYPDTLIAVAEDADGRVGGFLQLVPSPAIRGMSVSSMRRRRETPNGLMEFLIAETIAWVGEHDVTELSLNFSVFGDAFRNCSTLRRRVLRFTVRRFDRLFQIERLYSFNRKFHPEWRARWLCFELWGDLPAVGLAYLQAESLLTPPGPWVRTEDLAAR